MTVCVTVEDLPQEAIGAGWVEFFAQWLVFLTVALPVTVGQELERESAHRQDPWLKLPTNLPGDIYDFIFNLSLQNL